MATKGMPVRARYLVAEMVRMRWPWPPPPHVDLTEMVFEFHSCSRAETVWWFGLEVILLRVGFGKCFSGGGGRHDGGTATVAARVVVDLEGRLRRMHRQL
jgi:hypothetical protein